MPNMQTQETVSLIQRAIESSPVLGLSLLFSVGGIFLVSRLFLRNWANAEAERRKDMDKRHQIYFAQLESMNQAMIQAMDRGTAAIEESTTAQRETLVILGRGSRTNARTSGN